MADYAELLALGYDCNRTRHAYYRQLRLLHDHFQRDPRLITEEQVRDYLPHPKINKGGKNQRNFFQLKTSPLIFPYRSKLRDLSHQMQKLHHRAPFKLQILGD